MKPTLGNYTGDDGISRAVEINVDELVASRLVLTAMSGGGKSHALRRILEQTHGQIQQLIIDPEGEFYTLRERFPYVLAGEGGDCPAEVRSAGLLAQRLMELRTSAIIDIYALGAAHRIKFVRAFVESLLNMDKKLMHPCLVVIDEASKFAPEKGEGEAESREAIVDLMAQGRKKLLCPILATQRISKLDKSAVSEAHNMMIGKSILDIDVQRAGRYLGLTRGQDAAVIRSIKRGHFFTFGPAFSDSVIDVMVGDNATKTPKVGSKATAPIKPMAQIQAILGKLADLPAAAEEKLATEKQLRDRVAELSKELKATRTPAVAPAPTSADIQKAVDRAQAKWKQDSARAFLPLMKYVMSVAEKIPTLIPAESEWNPPVVVSQFEPPRTYTWGADQRVNHKPVLVKKPQTDAPDGEPLGKAQRRILTVLAQYPTGRSRTQVAILTGYASGGGGFLNALSWLRSRAYVEGVNDDLKISDTGLAALGDWEPLPTGYQLYEYWMTKLGKCERAVLSCLVKGGIASKAAVAEATNYEVSGGGFNNALSKLRSLELIRGKDILSASDQLYDR